MDTFMLIGLICLIVLPALIWFWSKMRLVLSELGVYPEPEHCLAHRLEGRSTHSGPTLDFVVIQSSEYGSTLTREVAVDAMWSQGSSGSKEPQS